MDAEDDNGTIFWPNDYEMSEDAVLRIEQIDLEEIFDEMREIMGDLFNEVFGDIDVPYMYNIYVFTGTEPNITRIELDGETFTVLIPMPDGFDSSDGFSVVMITDDGLRTKLNSWYEEGYIFFEISEFGRFALMEDAAEEVIETPEPPPMEEPEQPANNGSNGLFSTRAVFILSGLGMTIVGGIIGFTVFYLIYQKNVFGGTGRKGKHENF